MTLLPPAAPALNPTAIVTYSHASPGWATGQEEARQQDVLRLVAGLRRSGVAADADIFHPNEDWTRWGPRQVANADFVLIVISLAWKHAWEGTGDPLSHKGVRAEATAVRSIEQQGAAELQRRCRLIMLPGSTDDEIPVGMHGLQRHRVAAFERQDLEALIRDLTNQPRYPMPPLGSVPVLPPALTSHTPEVADLAGPGHSASATRGVAEPALSHPQERIDQLRSQLAALPAPLPGEGPHLPWYRMRQTIEGLLAAELRSPETNTPIGREPDVDWLAVMNPAIAWADQWQPRPTYAGAAVVLHLVPVPPAPLSQRALTTLEDAATNLTRALRLVDASAGLRPSIQAGDVVVEAETAHRRYDEASLGAFLGLRAQRSGQLSVWYSLPTDRMGSVLDAHLLERDLQQALGVGAALIRAGSGDKVERVAVAAELINTRLLTDGTVAQLGNRSRATMLGMLGRTPPRMEPDESIDRRHLEPPGSDPVAATVAKVLVRAWRN